MKMTSRPKSIRGATLPLTELSKFLGISTRTLHENVKQGCPVYQQGSPGIATIINVHDWLHWRDERIRTERPQQGNIDDSKSRINRAIAERKEFELAKAKEGFVDARDWQPFVEDVLVRMRETFIRMAERFREEMPEAKPMEPICAFMISDITAMLNQVSKGLKAIPEEAKK